MLRGTCLVLLLAAPRLGAQADLSVGAGAGSIRYAGGNSLGSFTISPMGSLGARSWSAGAAAGFGPLQGGGWAGQLRADAWSVLVGPGVRPAAAAVLEGSAQTDGPSTGVAHLLAEGVWTRDDWGAAAGIGASLAVITATEPASALRGRARAWGRVGTALASATVEPQLLQDAWFTDITVGLATPPGPVTASGWIAARLSDAYGSQAAGSVAAQIALSSRLAIEASGGSLLPDLYQGFPASGFVSLGVRVFLTHRPPAALRGGAGERRPAVAIREGPDVLVRFTVPDARQVAIAGEWSDWQPLPLTPTGPGTWQVRLTLAPGTYRFTLVVDGTRWLVPAGVVTVPDEMGGEQGLLVVP
ncbi:MAG TPA: glycogen-binding domain-containing protein [Gemmatimonadales bacterium]|nr:glycogen-binding domain-containing protein [Gemmatimonadales bacterium]